MKPPIRADNIVMVPVSITDATHFMNQKISGGGRVAGKAQANAGERISVIALASHRIGRIDTKTG